ncbi:hypothetical protein AMTRI_Chr11g96700 [Amborella trichopoda]
MSIYLSQSLRRSNASFLLCSGNTSQSSILCLGEEMSLVDTGPGTPRICMQDEHTRVPIDRAALRIRFFIDLVVGEALINERATARIENNVASLNVVAGEPLLLLPRRRRQNRAWMELSKIWQTNKRVKGFLMDKVKGGYLVAIAGFITFLPFCTLKSKRIANDRFTTEIINPKRMKIMVWCSNSSR